MLELLKEKLIFIQNCIAYDFREFMGQYALEVRYTNGQMDMFTTPMPPEKGNDTGDFKDEKEYFDTVNYLKSQGIPFHQ